MLRDYYTLTKLKNELQQLVGMKLIEIFSQEKNTTNFIFYDGANQYTLYFNISPFNSVCYINNKFARAKNNSADIFTYLVGDVLQEVNIANYDRILEFKFIKYSMFLFLFGGANSNLFVCNKNKNIIYAFNNSEKYLNKKLEFHKHEFLNISDMNNSNITIFEILTKSNLRLNKNYANEFLYRENILASEIIENLPFENIINKANNFIDEIIATNKYYILESKTKESKTNFREVIFSLITLKDYKLHSEYESISDALKKTHITRLIAAKKNIICKELLTKLKRDEKKILDNIRIAENLDEVLERADNYRTYAELLLSQTNIKSKIGNEIQLRNWNGNLINIKLDEKLNLLDNAQKYYAKSRKSLADIEVKQHRLPKLKEKLQQIQTAILDINNANSIKELNNIRNELIEKTLVIMQNEERAIDTKFRKFNLGEGYILYVGKNAANNDELTMKFAKPNDIWLHARGSSGSHCVVKLESGASVPEKLPKNILKTAAGIAAYYSGSKNAKYTPVCYTQKKYVRKPKGANIGAVILQKEEVIMVEPKLPAADNFNLL